MSSVERQDFGRVPKRQRIGVDRKGLEGIPPALGGWAVEHWQSLAVVRVGDGRGFGLEMDAIGRAFGPF